jgi:hypothetical protein
MKNEINDLINDISKTSIVDALLKAKKLAFHLKNENFIKWIDNELNGYSVDVIPDYRKVKTILLGTVTNGLTTLNNINLPLMKIDERCRKYIEKINIANSIGALDTTNDMYYPISSDYYSLFNLDNNYNVIDAKQKISSTLTKQIVITVKNRLLEFLLVISETNLDKNDIEESFQKIIFNGNMENCQININQNSKQKIGDRKISIFKNIKLNFAKMFYKMFPSLKKVNIQK